MTVVGIWPADEHGVHFFQALLVGLYCSCVLQYIQEDVRSFVISYSWVAANQLTESKLFHMAILSLPWNSLYSASSDYSPLQGKIKLCARKANLCVWFLCYENS